MNYYKIYKGDWYTIQKYASLQEAQAAATALGPDYGAEFYEEYIPIGVEQRLEMDLNFGSELVKTFVYDNREMGTTQEQNDAILVKFRDILAFAQTGAIESINAHLPNITTDEVFTQARKDKYISMVTVYLSQF